MYLIVLLVLAFLFYRWFTSKFDYFRERAVPFLKPTFPFGTVPNFFTNKANIIEHLLKQYNEFDEKVVGTFQFRDPVYFIRDPALIKIITVKDFEYFADHTIAMDEDIDPLVGKSLVGLKGHKWRDMRTTLSPAFTGNKMRQMLKLMNQVGKQSCVAVKSQIDKTGQILEMKEFLRKFTIDIVGTCAFGIEVNSFEHPDNEFQNFATNATNFSDPRVFAKMIGYMAIPKLMKILKINLLNKKVCDFFQSAIVDVMKDREAKGIVRHDMIHLLMEAKRGNLDYSEEDKSLDGFATVEESELGKSKVTRKWDDEDIAAQAFLFLLAGYTTVLATMSFMAYELTVNPEIQEKLRREVDETNKLLDGTDITYEHLQEMKYLDQVVSETLRKWPAVPGMDRLCVKDYELKYDNKTLLIEKGVGLFIPTMAFHRHPKFFPHPERFDPDRFSDENKHKINLNAYMPFGIGPRNCIGSRFALMELKVIFYHLLLNFTLEVCEKTQIPLKLSNSQFEMKTEKGIWIEFRPRN